MFQAVFQGLFSSFIAIIMLLAILFVIRQEFVQLFQLFRLNYLLLVMGIVIASGIVICLLSTYFVVNRLVSLGTDELYY
jgi:cell division transport system permease protein